MPFKLDFKQIAEDTDIYAVAKLLDLKVVKDRADCPVCDSERALQFFPETNSFQCHAAGETRNSDCIALYAHIQGVGMYQAAKALKEQFGAATAARTPSTTPQKPDGGTSPSASKAAAPARKKSEPHDFDPDKFAAKLQYTEEVAELGIKQEDAERLRIGFHPLRKRVYFPIRNEDGSYSGFVGFDASAEPILKMPPMWRGTNVVPLKKLA